MKWTPSSEPNFLAQSRPDWSIAPHRQAHIWAQEIRFAVMKDGKRKVYPASKARFHPMWAALKAAGVPISGSWPWWERNISKSEPTNKDWAEHSQRCLREAAECDILIL